MIRSNANKNESTLMSERWEGNGAIDYSISYLELIVSKECLLKVKKLIN
jgi:hypothetical protein